MKNILRYAFVMALVASSTALFGQYPLPQANDTAPQTTCPGCPALRTSAASTVPPPAVLKTVPFGDPIAGFTGRFLDSTFVADWQALFRTGRAGEALYVPERGRIVMKIGSAVVSYNVNTFFNRLAARDPLQSSSGFPSLTGSNSISQRNRTDPQYAYEYMLPWDKYFYPEYTNSDWVINLGDGQQKLYGFDADDRGYVYTSSPEYHWGILFDDKGTGATLMESMFQDPNFGPDSIFVIKGSSGKYYCIVGRLADGFMQLWDVTSPHTPLRQPRNVPFHIRAGAHTSDHFAGVADDGSLYIWTGDTLGGGGTFDKKITNAGGFSYNTVTTDGTNFYAAAARYPDSIITILRPNGTGGYTQTDTSVAGLEIFTMRYGSGDFLGVAGALDAPHLFKLVGGVPQEVTFANNFMKAYYKSSGNPIYANPPGASTSTVLPIALGGKQYIIASVTSLGDVYEIKNEDSVAPASQGHKGANNNNAPARLNTNDVFYGDKVGFIAVTPALSPKTINWTFGNGETASDPNTQPGTTGVAVTHQYSGLTTAQIPITRTVTVTDPSTNSTGSTDVTLKMPTARFGITGVTALVTGAATGVALMPGDKFFDASDGDVEGHYDEWVIDTVTTLTKPYVAADNSYLVSSGACGAHSLTFAAHYGPYNANLATIGTDFKVGLAPAGTFSYTVQPFAATVAAPTRDSVNSALIFAATTRTTTDTTILSAAQVLALTYKWDLVDLNDAVVVSGPGGTGIVTVPSWSVPLASFNQPNLRVRLTLTSPTAPGLTCASITSSKTYSAKLNAPDPSISGDCATGGPQCTFTAASLSGVNIASDGWTTSWSLSPNTANPALGSGATFAPIFTQNGSYTLTLTATNSIDTRVTTKTFAVTKSSACPTMTTDNWFLTYAGGNSGCRYNNATACQTNETLSFSAAPSGYPTACATHTFSWNFGDGSPAVSGQDVVHTYASGGQRTVTLTIGNGQQNFQETASVSVQGVVVQPPITPPTGCAFMTTDNWAATFTAPSGCTYINNANTACSTSESISFSLQPIAYLISCHDHSFSWNFNDGSAPVVGQSVNHSFTTGGTYNITITVNNGSQLLSVPATVRVGGVVNNCPTMDAGHVFLQYTAPSGCNHASAAIPCAPNESLLMSVGFFSYDDGCSTHTYTWDFGDGTQGATGRSVTHQYAAGTYTAKVTVNNGKQSFLATAPVVVAAKATPTFTADFTTITDTHDLNLVAFTPSVDPKTTPVTKVSWDFGDGSQTTKTTLAQVTNTYTKPGSYTVTMTVQATGSSNVIVSHTVVVILPSRSRGARH